MYLLAISKVLAGEDSVSRYDLFRFISCMQGLLNRDTPTLFLLWEEHDRFWLDYITSHGKFLEKEPCIPLSSLEELLTVFHLIVNLHSLSRLHRRPSAVI